MERMTFASLMEQAEALHVSDEEYEHALNKRDPAQPRVGIECGLCGNHEYTFVVRDGERFTRECSCRARRDNIARIEKSGLKEQMLRCTFESFQTPEAWQQQAKADVLQFVEDQGRGWLLLCGQSGCGKSHLCTAAAARFIRSGIETRYMRWVDESAALKAVINDEAAYGSRIGKLKTCKVLYIDDFFKTQSGQYPTPADVRLAFDLLDYRYCNRGLVTIISTERYVDDLLEIDEAVGGRIFERSKDYRIEIGQRSGRNWRMRA